MTPAASLALLSLVGADGVDVVARSDIPADPSRPTLVILSGGDDIAPPAEIRFAARRDHPLAQAPWKAAPRAAVRRVSLPRGFRTIATAGDLPLLAHGRLGGVDVVVWTAPLSAQQNQGLRAWSALPYVLHGAALVAGGRPVPAPAQWERSPIPGRQTALVAGVVLLLLWPLTILAFRRARRARQPPAEVLARYAAPGKDKEPAWQDPSFARPLGGFFVFLAGSVLLLAPYFWLATVIVPNRVQPFPQVDGIWEPIVVLFEIVFFLFDFATNTAFVRFFAATRVRDPARALRYAQLFLWWQVLSGLLQVTGIAILVFAGPLSETVYVFYGFFLLLHGIVQFPGLFGVAFHLLQASQRFDYASMTDVLEKRVFKILLPIPFVLAFRAWGRAHPAYGEAFGAIVGLGIGAYVTQWLSLGTGLLFCRKAGLPVRPLFGATFTKEEVREVFAFGAKAIPGQVAYRAANSIETVILVVFLVNSSEWLGIRSLLETRFSYLILLAYPFFDSGVAVFGEAFGSGKRALAQYLVARFLQFATLWGALVFAILAALGPGFILGAIEPQWHRAAEFVALAAFAKALACPGWVSDALQRGANRPLLFSAVLTGEQVLRLGLFVVLVPRYQFTGLYAAVVTTLALKTLIAWYVNHRRILPLRVSVWQSFGAPLATGAVLYFLLTLTLGFFPPTSSFAAQVVFYGGAVFAIVAALFLLGLFGGLDAQGLSEIDRAACMTSLLSPIARVLAAAARAGARLSPLHDRFPQPTTTDALREAEEIRTAHAL